MPYHIMKAKGKDAYYVYDMEGKRHSKEPMELAMAKKQMVALNIAHARKMGADIPKVHKAGVKVIKEHPGAKTEHKYSRHAKKVARAVEEAAHQKEMKPHSRFTGSKTDKAMDMAEKVVQVMHSPDGMLSPVVSETTGGGSGLANDMQFIEHPYRRTNAHMMSQGHKDREDERLAAEVRGLKHHEKM
jgi:hypothetical protein